MSKWSQTTVQTLRSCIKQRRHAYETRRIRILVNFHFSTIKCNTARTSLSFHGGWGLKGSVQEKSPDLALLCVDGVGLHAVQMLWGWWNISVYINIALGCSFMYVHDWKDRMTEDMLYPIVHTNVIAYQIPTGPKRASTNFEMCRLYCELPGVA